MIPFNIIMNNNKILLFPIENRGIKLLKYKKTQMKTVNDVIPMSRYMMELILRLTGHKLGILLVGSCSQKE